jgi:hypothetical protein
MERWGVFSTVDHKDHIQLATELLIYDKIATPSPTLGDTKRWERRKWDPAKLAKTSERLKKEGLLYEVDWNAERQKNWRLLFKEAKADIERINRQGQAETKTYLKNNPSILKAGDKHLFKLIEEAAYAMTKQEMIRHLGGLSNEGKIPIHNGKVDFYAAYRSNEEFDTWHPEQNAVEKGVARVNFLITHRIAIPDELPDKLLESAIKIATKDDFRKSRQKLYDWQINQVKEGTKREAQRVVADLDKLVKEFNNSSGVDEHRSRSETVITVLTVGAAAISALTGSAHSLIPVLLGLNSAVTAIWKKLLPKPDKIATPEAMFHQIGKETNFVYRSPSSSTEYRKQS